MSIRIRREEIYIPLPISIKHILAMKGKKTYSIPLDDVCMSQDAFMSNEGLPVAFLKLANGSVIKCLVVQHGAGEPCVGIEDAWTNHVRYCADCKICKESDTAQLGLSRIEEIGFRLCWKNGKFYPMAKK